MKPVQLLLALALGVAPLASFAQWQWVDKDGRRVFSDQAPPPDIPDKNILRRAGPAPRALSSAEKEAAAKVASDAASAPKAAGVDKELQDKAKAAEAAEAAKQKAEQDRIAKARAENCARSRQAKATLDSGMRVARVNAQGEREFMDDAAKAAELRRVQAAIDSDCKPM